MNKKVAYTSGGIIITAIAIWMATHLITINSPHHLYDKKESIVTTGVLNVAIDYSPLSYQVSGDSISGFDYELLQLLSRHAHIKIDIHPETGLTNSLRLLDNGIYDVIAQQIPITTENKQNYIFTKPLLLNKQVLIQRKDSTGNVSIRNQLDLSGCTLHIAEDAPTRLRIENLAHEIGDTIYICEMPDYGAEQLIILVATGEIDYAVCDEIKAQAIAQDYPNIDYKTDISFTQFMSWTLKPSSTTLRDSLDLWLSQIQQTEEYRQLYTRYFGIKNYERHLLVGE